MNILMVCLGNICRSPLAQGILEAKVNSTTFFIDSAGTSGFHEGALPDARSIAVAQKYNINITKQRSRKFTVLDFEKFDIIYAMDKSNFENIRKLARTSKDSSKIKLILNELSDKTTDEVPDPYYGGANGFEDVYEMLNEACTRIVSKLEQQ